MDQQQMLSLFKTEIRLLQQTKYLIFQCNLQPNSSVLSFSVRRRREKQNEADECIHSLLLLQTSLFTHHKWACVPAEDKFHLILSVAFCGGKALIDKHPPPDSAVTAKSYCPLLYVPAFCWGLLLRNWNMHLNLSCPSSQLNCLV